MSSPPPSGAPPRIFDRALAARRRARASARFAAFDFLHRRVMADIVDRLESVTRDFPQALVYGASGLESLITPACGVGDILRADLAAERLAGPGPALVFDEERNPFAPARFDLIVSVLSLHAVNDLVGALIQHRAALKPDGLFVAALFGEETLSSLRAALYAAECAIRGGASPRVAPFADVRSLGATLQRAGFAMPVADIDSIRVRYENPIRLLRDLRGMGEANALAERPRPLTRAIAADALARFSAQGGEARFDIVYLTGWAPAEDQPKPLRPGSATHSLADAVRAQRRR
ncbi:methyltransferase domain-containing protein [Amphiplicatus metriothermophilus]|uniref:Methyltransferase domain-containing protein n=1 Tax=Amphiplicatus metriothermophilus TaxID=1519374 RepID=A0A239PKC8_9PROT|nr:methyltransferase domain-containing protein [Amphiplicatus metriothermophilus]MBB5517887.1 SAM-dependent methyltransferase [Amphiplicatus metriothermophilus]SNT67779.1 Methyltransferase domain-containing protein [Amphiplicatus metriothermophilus]